MLSEKALKSPWVRREIDLLLWRRALGSSVLIIPVLLDGLQREKVRTSGFSELESIEFARASGGESGAAQGEAVGPRTAVSLTDLAAALYYRLMRTGNLQDPVPRDGHARGDR